MSIEHEHVRKGMRIIISHLGPVIMIIKNFQIENENTCVQCVKSYGSEPLHSETKFQNLNQVVGWPVIE